MSAPVLKKAIRALKRTRSYARSLCGGYRIRYGTIISPSAYITGDVEIGRYCNIASHVQIEGQGGTIRLGDQVTLNVFCVLYGAGGLTIGDHSRIAAHVTIVTSEHSHADKNTLIAAQGTTAKGVEIGRDVWIGAGAVILDGARIGDGCVIGAGAVVKGALEPYGVYAGVPARKIRARA